MGTRGAVDLAVSACAANDLTTARQVGSSAVNFATATRAAANAALRAKCRASHYATARATARLNRTGSIRVTGHVTQTARASA